MNSYTKLVIPQKGNYPEEQQISYYYCTAQI